MTDAEQLAQQQQQQFPGAKTTDAEQLAQQQQQFPRANPNLVAQQQVGMTDANQLAQQFPRAMNSPPLVPGPSPFKETKDWDQHRGAYEQKSRDSIKDGFRYSARVTFISRFGAEIAKRFKGDATTTRQASNAQAPFTNNVPSDPNARGQQGFPSSDVNASPIAPATQPGYRELPSDPNSRLQQSSVAPDVNAVPIVAPPPYAATDAGATPNEASSNVPRNPQFQNQPLQGQQYGEQLGQGSVDHFAGSAVTPILNNTFVIARGFNDAAELLAWFNAPFGDNVGPHQDRAYVSPRTVGAKEPAITASAVSFVVHDRLRTGDQGSTLTEKTGDPAIWEPWLDEGTVEEHARSQFLKDARVDLTKPMWDTSSAQRPNLGQEVGQQTGYAQGQGPNYQGTQNYQGRKDPNYQAANDPNLKGVNDPSVYPKRMTKKDGETKIVNEASGEAAAKAEGYAVVA
jgi:hypothetical protein